MRPQSPRGYSAAGEMRWVFALWFTLLLLATATRARAQSEASSTALLSVTLEEGAESCPDAEALTAHVERVRGDQATGASSAYRIRFSYRGGVFRAAIQVGEATGTRVLSDRGATCASLEQATAVTLALLLDSDLREPATEPPDAPVAPPTRAPPTPPPPPEPAPSRKAVSLTLSLGGAGLLGVVQPIVPAALGELGIGVDRFRTNLGVLWMPSQELEFGPGSLDETLLAGTARTCLSAWRGTALRFDLCSGIYAGLLKVRARGYAQNDVVEKTWLAVPVGFALATSSSPVGLELGASALVPLRRNDFSIDYLGVAYESWPVGMLLSLRMVGTWVL
jgi:hypothetical protein